MSRYLPISCLICFAFSITSYGAEADRFFDSASTLAGRSESIANIMSKYKSTTKGSGPDQRQADLALLWSIAETGSICAILGGNLIGAAGLMDRATRDDFMERVMGSILLCREFASEKRRFLDILPQVRNDEATKKFAADLAVQLRAMDAEFREFSSR